MVETSNVGGHGGGTEDITGYDEKGKGVGYTPLIAEMAGREVKHPKLAKFYDEELPQSVVKATIVYKYFCAWARIMKPRTRNFGYIDLYAGPGVYRTGTPSTPIKVFDECVERYANEIHLYFNDDEPEHIENLRQRIQGHPRYDALRHEPIFATNSVNGDIPADVEPFLRMPCFAFVDPCGYSGLSQELVLRLLDGWGSDCLLFFNYNDISRGITNGLVKTHMDRIFGQEVLERIVRLIEKETSSRENIIINEFAQVFKNQGYHVLPFKFIFRDRNATSHYLIFITRNGIGYSIMKDIMALESIQEDRVANFTYIPETNKQLTMLYSLQENIEALCEDLQSTYRGRRIPMRAIYDMHNIDTPYRLCNYKDALKRLEQRGRIKCNPPADKRMRGTMADKVIVTFDG